MKRRADPNQTLINWGNPEAPGVAAASSIPDPIKLAAEALPPLVQRLPWDFITTFPLPSDEAIDAGVLDETDREPENLKSLHEDYSHQCLARLKALDMVMDARRRGLDPETGKPPRTHAIRERLCKYLAEEAGRLEHMFHILIETYENAFGVQAAAAFAKCIHARHAGIPVEIESRRSEKMNIDQQLAEKPLAKAASPSTRRSPIVLPVPKPLPEAIAAGHFGEHDGLKVRPTPTEVRAITEDHAEKIIDLLNGLRAVDRALGSSQCSDRGRVEAEAARLRQEMKSAIHKYAASFGHEAGERLEAYCRRQQKVNTGRGR